MKSNLVIPTTDAVDLSLILPLYNEASILRTNLDLIRTTLESSGWRYEMILIDDCSQDQTASIGRAFSAEHPRRVRFIQHEKNFGRGATVVDGIRRAVGMVVGFIDVDCEASPLYMLDLVPRILNGTADVVTGRRIYPFTLAAFARVVASLSYRVIEHRVLRTRFLDSQTGYKFFRRSAILPVVELCRDRGWFWDTEILVLASLAGLKIEERPILFLRNPAKRSTVRLVRDAVQMLRALIGFRSRIRVLRTNPLSLSHSHGTGLKNSTLQPAETTHEVSRLSRSL